MEGAVHITSEMEENDPGDIFVPKRYINVPRFKNPVPVTVITVPPTRKLVSFVYLRDMHILSGPEFTDRLLDVQSSIIYDK